ncbi:E3 ubiquitin-protein ligase MPSR1-like [Cynara cardunculus var. scolymus]|uniref:E3 ubiquitin-protein ligase MPSR1-like n=1 Tax=Cynara cardunculus var. scolymus TaxID=59895 RepID=UPI000D628524|nr:E3 ubiquitin-protein ligase MPSR1-like [Cynara cardunculus var. scolymus]
MEDHNSTTTTSSTTDVNSKRLEVWLPEDNISAMLKVVVPAATGVCTVCMESFQSSCKQAPCGHVYHDGCITKWLSFCNSCPICRSKVLDLRLEIGSDKSSNARLA